MGATTGGLFGWVMELVVRVAPAPMDKGPLPGVVAVVPAGNGGLARPARFAPRLLVPRDYALAA